MQGHGHDTLLRVTLEHELRVHHLVEEVIARAREQGQE
jgi:hypothetical protein